ncbi:MAG: hypothetical protein KC731_31745 [Myxococcales bacterium]|nr:hypothetical protein [Myxococcales bacterium]
MKLSVVVVALGLAAVGACGEDGVGGEGGSGSGTATGTNTGSPPAGTPTFWGDVAPILYDNCVSCHADGGIAPLSLVSYGEARAVGPAIAGVTANRTMPPWGADNTGDCHTWQDARWLSEEDIALIAAWVDADMPEGDPALAPEMPAPPAGLAEVSATLDIGVEFTPDDSQPDDYRCFLVDPGITQDMFLTAHHVKPGDPRVVHHVILYSLETVEAEQEAIALDAGEAGPGYRCFGGPKVGDSNFIGGWAPGTPPTIYPAGTGVRLAAGRKAVLQVHYNTVNGAFPDRTKMDVTLAADVPREATIAQIGAYDLVLPPGMKYLAQSSTTSNPAPVPVAVHGVFPHMHELGVDMRVEANGECLVDVPAWDFNWQQFYFYDEPVIVDPAADLTITCGYSTLGRSETTFWGDGTQDEMCINFFYVTLP